MALKAAFLRQKSAEAQKKSEKQNAKVGVFGSNSGGNFVNERRRVKVIVFFYESTGAASQSGDFDASASSRSKTV